MLRSLRTPHDACSATVTPRYSRGASAEITFPESGAGTTVPASDSSWWQSWPVLVGLALLVLLLALLFWMLRRRTPRQDDDEPLAEPEVVATW